LESNEFKTDALITVHGKQTLDDPEADDISLVTQGRFYRRKGIWYISYDETEVTGMTGTRTTVRVAPEAVTVIRTGRYPSTMEFEVGKRHRTIYRTDWGDLEFGVVTRSVSKDLTEQGGELKVSYGLEVEHARVSDNDLHISIQSC
jgi:uncharacterized beta-barrel protein YwiB (DUF1934 family)